MSPACSRHAVRIAAVMASSTGILVCEPSHTVSRGCGSPALSTTGVASPISPAKRVPSMVADMTSHPQVFAQHLPRLQCQRKAEIAVEMPFVRLVEQHGRHAVQLGIVEDAIDEYGLGHDEDSSYRRLPAVEARQVADPLARLLTKQFRHTLCSGRAPRRGGET